MLSQKDIEQILKIEIQHEESLKQLRQKYSNIADKERNSLQKDVDVFQKKLSNLNEQNLTISNTSNKDIQTHESDTLEMIESKKKQITTLIENKLDAINQK